MSAVIVNVYWENRDTIYMKYRSHGERYLSAIRRASRESATEEDQHNLFKAAQYYQEYLLHGISSIADILATSDEDNIAPATRAELAEVINELTSLVFDCTKVTSDFYTRNSHNNTGKKESPASNA